MPIAGVRHLMCRIVCVLKWDASSQSRCLGLLLDTFHVPLPAFRMMPPNRRPPHPHSSQPARDFIIITSHPVLGPPHRSLQHAARCITQVPPRLRGESQECQSCRYPPVVGRRLLPLRPWCESSSTSAHRTLPIEPHSLAKYWLTADSGSQVRVLRRSPDAAPWRGKPSRYRHERCA